MFQKIKSKLSDLATPANAILLAVAIVVVFWVVATISVMNHNYDLQRQVDQSKLDNQVAKLRNENLKLEQSFYKTDEYMDLSARSLLGKASLGEHLVILPKVTTTDDGSANTGGTATTAKSNLDQWLDFLMGKKN